MPVGTHGVIKDRLLPDGQHRARCRFRDFDGTVRLVERTGKTKTAATNALTAALRDRFDAGQAGSLDTNSRMTVAIDAWLRSVDDSVTMSVNTKRLYRLNAEKHVRPALGQLYLREVTVPALDRCLRAVRDHAGRGAAKTTRSVISGVLAKAVRDGAIPSNSARDAMSLPAARKSATRALTRDESEVVCDRLRSSTRAVDWDLPDLVEWMLYTGCRIGEALAVRAGLNHDHQPLLDLQAGTWEVNATVIRVTGEGLRIQERTKSEAGWRVLALPPGAVEMIKRRQGERRLRAPGGILFGSPSAKALRDPSNTQADLRATFAALDCPRCNGTGRVAGDAGKLVACTGRGRFAWATSHTLRKTVATRLDQAGVSARAIADQLGHAKPSMTQDVYMGRNVVNAAAAKLLDR